MSFTDDVKQELIHSQCKWECCARAEICAAILLSGGLSFRGKGRYGLSINIKRVAASRYYYSLIKKFMGVSVGISTSRYNRLGEQTEVELSFPEETAEEAIKTLMLHDEKALFGIAEKPAPAITENPCCKAAFLKSAFIITGSILNPERAYSVTLSLSSLKAAEHLKQLCLGEGISAGVSTNRSRYVVYIKNAESESVFLTLIGAHSARLKLENVRIMKDIKNSANRQANCDNNNIERVIKTSASQAEDIRFLAAHAQKLPDWAREIMSLRLENPDSSLSELGEMCDPPIGKSGVNNRLRRLSELARRLRGDG